MKASELRIGNLVMIKNDLLPETNGKIYRVLGIEEKNDYEFEESTGVVSLCPINPDWRRYNQFDEFVEPIPLTEEWLLKFGFKKRYKAFAKGDFTFIENSGMAYKLSIVDNMPKYVHQLQNLYFALTGEELTLSE